MMHIMGENLKKPDLYCPNRAGGYGKVSCTFSHTAKGYSLRQKFPTVVLDKNERVTRPGVGLAARSLLYSR